MWCCGRLSAEFDALYADSGRPSIAPEYILRALAVAGVLLGALGAVAGRADRLQPACFAGSWAWAWTTRCGTMRCSRRTATGLLTVRCGAAVLCRSEQAGEAVHERRALHGGRHADPGVGLAKELPLARTALMTATELIFMARSARTRRMNRPPMPMRGCTRRATARSRS